MKSLLVKFGVILIGLSIFGCAEMRGGIGNLSARLICMRVSIMRKV